MDVFDRCLILDGHSFPSRPLPFELDRSPDRPDVCPGTDAFHTPEQLVGTVESYFRRHGLSTARNRPYGGAYVPSGFQEKDRRVASLLIEINRGLYMDEVTGEKSGSFEEVGGMIRGLLGRVCDFLSERDGSAGSVNCRQ